MLCVWYQILHLLVQVFSAVEKYVVGFFSSVHIYGWWENEIVQKELKQIIQTWLVLCISPGSKFQAKMKVKFAKQV